jgi:ribonuclease HI
LANAVENLPESDPQQAEQHETDGAPSGGTKEGKGEIGAVIKVKIDGEEVELADQIQLYATNDQVSSDTLFLSHIDQGTNN